MLIPSEFEFDFEDVTDYNIYRMKKNNSYSQQYYLGIYGTINGYHHFRTKPSDERFCKPLSCVREPDNLYDKNAIKVVSPTDFVMFGRVPRLLCANNSS